MPVVIDKHKKHRNGVVCYKGQVAEETEGNLLTHVHLENGRITEVDLLFVAICVCMCVLIVN